VLTELVGAFQRTGEHKIALILAPPADAASTLFKFLTSPAAAAVIKAAGMEPGDSEGFAALGTKTTLLRAYPWHCDRRPAIPDLKPSIVNSRNGWVAKTETRGRDDFLASDDEKRIGANNRRVGWPPECPGTGVTSGPAIPEKPSGLMCRYRAFPRPNEICNGWWAPIFDCWEPQPRNAAGGRSEPARVHGSKCHTPRLLPHAST
jgi:hypothetical protein